MHDNPSPEEIRGALLALLDPILDRSHAAPSEDRSAAILREDELDRPLSVYHQGALYFAREWLMQCDACPPWEDEIHTACVKGMKVRDAMPLVTRLRAWIAEAELRSPQKMVPHHLLSGWARIDAANRTPVVSDDFRSVNWFGARYTFSAMQAACVRILWENWKRGTPELADSTILEAAESTSERLGIVFRDHPAWGRMIVEGSTKGTHRLQPPHP